MDDDNDSELPGPRRKRKAGVDQEEYIPHKYSGKDKGCVIHHDSIKDDDKLISPRDFDSWITILNAANIRQYIVILDISSSLNERGVPDDVCVPQRL